MQTRRRVVQGPTHLEHDDAETRSYWWILTTVEWCDNWSLIPDEADTRWRWYSSQPSTRTLQMVFGMWVNEIDNCECFSWNLERESWFSCIHHWTAVLCGSGKYQYPLQGGSLQILTAKGVSIAKIFKRKWSKTGNSRRGGGGGGGWWF